MNCSSFRLLLCLIGALPSYAADVAANPSAKAAPVKLTDAPTRKLSRVYHVTPEGELKLHLFLPQAGRASDRRPAIIFFHGAGGGAEVFFSQAEYFASRGLVCASADYPVYRKEGEIFRADESLGQAKAAVRWLKGHASEFGIDPQKLIAGGGSWGGMLALQTALVPGFDSGADDRSIPCEPSALVLFNPSINIRPNLVDAAGARIGEKIAPALFQKKNAPPAIFFFGTADRLNELAPGFIAKSRELGNRCDYFTAADQPHGFFNREPWTTATCLEVDRFLVSLGYLSGPATLIPKATLTAIK